MGRTRSLAGAHPDGSGKTRAGVANVRQGPGCVWEKCYEREESAHIDAPISGMRPGLTSPIQPPARRYFAYFVRISPGDAPPPGRG